MKAKKDGRDTKTQRCDGHIQKDAVVVCTQFECSFYRPWTPHMYKCHTMDDSGRYLHLL